MSLSIRLWKTCWSFVSHLVFAALWENDPDFAHSLTSHFRRTKEKIQFVEIKEKFSVIHRIVPDIVY